MRAFFDTNVLLDVLAERRPFYRQSATMWSLSEQGKVEGLVSAAGFTDVFYLMRKWADLAAGREALCLVRDAFTAVSCDSLVINQAIDSELEDFEDAVQYYSALHAEADCILSRNPGDFPRRPAIPVLSPTEFLARLEAD